MSGERWERRRLACNEREARTFLAADENDLKKSIDLPRTQIDDRFTLSSTKRITRDQVERTIALILFLRVNPRLIQFALRAHCRRDACAPSISQESSINLI